MRLGSKSLALAVAGCSCVAASVLAVSEACVVAPPPDVPTTPDRPPRILQDALSPPDGVPLSDWPNLLIIPVQVDSAITQFDYEVFVDYSPDMPVLATPATGFVQQGTVAVSGSLADGGVLTFSVRIQSSAYDLGACHRIEVMVALDFVSIHVPDSRGSDSAEWVYGGSGAPYGCPEYDAGAYQDGFVGTADVSDALPISPESGGDL
jgi:hypothetical protein